MTANLLSSNSMDDIQEIRTAKPVHNALKGTEHEPF